MTTQADSISLGYTGARRSSVTGHYLLGNGYLNRHG